MKLSEICLLEVLDNRTKLNVVKALEKARDVLSKDYRVVRSKVTDKGTARGRKLFTSFEMEIQFLQDGDDSPFEKEKLKSGMEDEIFQDLKKEFNKFRIDVIPGGGQIRPETFEASIEITGHRDAVVDIRVLFGNP